MPHLNRLRPHALYAFLFLAALLASAENNTPSGGAEAPAAASSSTPPPGQSGTSPPSGGPPERSIADILEASGPLSDPAVRASVLAEVQNLQRSRRAEALEKARDRGLPQRVETPNGSVRELVDFVEGAPVYLTTLNREAAISTGADVLREAPESLRGNGLVVGVWDGGSVRASHQEFATGNRVRVMDGAAPITHATHVGGTIAAAGVTARAQGMAPEIFVDSYDWIDDKAEMIDRAATFPGESGKIYLSNHSYTIITGWHFVNSGSPSRVYEWHGSGTTANSIDPRFGVYNSFSRDSDAIAYSAPYYLMFRAAGNDRGNNPTNGQTVALSPGSSTVVAYDSSLHPAGDGIYRNGYDTLGFDSVAKNVITVGAVSDAVSSGQRDLSNASMSSFSSWGPTDDGRIKPDLVANGVGVYSTSNGSNTAYSTLSGSSMAAPNATGTAALLIEKYARLFPGGAMRSSTLRGLLIHTADDLGNPGPDYRYGWGLINAVAAAELLQDHADFPIKKRLTEALITPAEPIISHEFVWDGVSPIRATLAWTDPAGTATSTSDLRTPRLRNNLDLRIIDSVGNEYFPYVMPFVGTWTLESLELPATTGVNNTDNVEQVFIAAPPVAGTYRAVISYQGSLTNNQQYYSLLISGSANETPPPPPLSITAISPATALPGPVTLTVEGNALQAGATLRLERGSDRIDGTTTEVQSNLLRASIDLTGAAPGLWNVVVENPDQETATLIDAFEVVSALWNETFDGEVTGWGGNLDTNNGWRLVSDQSHTAPTAYFAPGPATKSTQWLESPPIAIPGNAEDLRFSFWHAYDLENRRDGARIEFKVDNGNWFDPTSSNSGMSMVSGGYDDSILPAGGPQNASDFRQTDAWTGNSNGFIETIINFTDNAKFAGKTLQVRWGLATNSSVASPGWWVDTVSLTSGGDLSNQPPTIDSLATSSTETETEGTGETAVDYVIVRGSSLGLTVTASDDGGEANLTYTWSAVHQTSAPLPVFFSPNADNAAKASTAFFEGAGDYTLTINVSDAEGLSRSRSLNVRVYQTASAINVEPLSTSVTLGGTRAFSATVVDQFSTPLGSQPSAFNWTRSGGGTIDAEGLFTATTAGELFTVTASDGELSGNASITVNPAPATVSLGDLIAVFDGTPKPVSVLTEPTGLSVAITYDGEPDAPSAVGSYAVEAIITDPNYQGSAEGTLVIEAGEDNYDTWAAANELSDADADPLADPDGDGIVNLLEYALGGDPRVPNTIQAFSIQIIDTQTEISFFRAAADLLYEVLASSELTDWEVIATNPGEVGENVKLTDPKTVSENPRRFFRLRVTRP
ncbi:MAG: hypothetical protein EA353_09615 [Puniceicoccaceae bacterium]|nr:MAG: hypothetical protein EA353_09615 [Puniceicoccaceae bacterium]